MLGQGHTLVAPEQGTGFIRLHLEGGSSRRGPYVANAVVGTLWRGGYLTETAPDSEQFWINDAGRAKLAELLAANERGTIMAEQAFRILASWLTTEHSDWLFNLEGAIAAIKSGQVQVNHQIVQNPLFSVRHLDNVMITRGDGTSSGADVWLD